MTVTTPYGVSIWRSIRYSCDELRKNKRIKVANAARIVLCMDTWYEDGRLENLFPDISTLVSHQNKFTDHWSPQRCNFIFRRNLNDLGDTEGS